MYKYAGKIFNLSKFSYIKESVIKIFFLREIFRKAWNPLT